jgi:DDE superfamily endonuclease
MPRNSLRQQLLNRLQDLIVVAVKHATRLRLYGLSPTRVDDLLHRLRDLHRKIDSRRYLSSRCRYRKRTTRFHTYLDTDHDDCLDDTEFLHHFRVSRGSFWELVSLLEGHPAFLRRSSDSRGAPPKPASHQLLVLLKYYGCQGNQASSRTLSAFFGVASGVIDDCRNNALDALLSLEERTYIWPDAEERRIIASRIQQKYKFPHCVGLIDGTLLPLASRPLLHGENYLSRKRFYAIVMLVVCDDNSRITYYHVGWPGSVHDNRVWRNCQLYKRQEEYFSNRQYLLGDSAFTASTIMIPPFKSSAGRTLSNNKTAFNTLLAKPRVKSEHCIGILKGRICFLRDIRLRLGSKEDMLRIIKYVRGAVVLHNYLRTEDTDRDWIQEEQCDWNDDLDPESAAMGGNAANYSRRDELFYYLSELEDTPIN